MLSCHAYSGGVVYKEKLYMFMFLVDLPKSFRLRGKYLLHFFNDQIFEKLNA